MNSFELSKAVEARLIGAVEESKGLYETANEEYLQALNRREDLGPIHPDGALTYRQALINRDRTLANFNRALIRFNRFILDGKLPES
jgi:hypothetical protein